MGFEGNGLVCANIDECSTDADNCDANAACTDTNPGFSRECNVGYLGDGTVCTADIAMAQQSYASPNYDWPACPLPAQVVEISGVSGDCRAHQCACYPAVALNAPAPDSSDTLYLEYVRQGNGTFAWAKFNAEASTQGLGIDKRPGSIIDWDAAGSETFRVNFYEGWTARFHVFNPTKPYGHTYLFDVLIVNDRVKIALE